MILLKNNKNIVITFEGIRIEPLGQVTISDEEWTELYKRREIRESIAINYLIAKNIPEQKNNSTTTENKKKGK